MARQFFEGGSSQQAAAIPSFSMQRHAMPHEAERFMNAPPPQAAGPDLQQAWNEMHNTGRSMGSDMQMQRMQAAPSGWGVEFDSVAQIARPSGQQSMPMQSNRTFSPETLCGTAAR